MTKTFKTTRQDQYIQQGSFYAGRYTFMCNVRHHLDVLTFAFKNKQGVWHEYQLPCKAGRWVDNASVDFTLSEDMTAFSLCAKDASEANPVFIQMPFLELAENKGAYGNNIKDYIESLEEGFRTESINAVLDGGKLSVSELSDDKGSVQFNVPLLNSTIKNRFDLSKNKSKPNYIPFGFWDIDTKYSRTEFGIPFVKVGTPGDYFVYSLQVQSSIGKNPTINFGKGKDWKLVESLEFIFMQQAYIEQLQAELVTAERIEAMDIKTSRLEVLDGAKIGGLNVYNGIITTLSRDMNLVNGDNVYLGKDELSLKEYSLEQIDGVLLENRDSHVITKTGGGVYKYKKIGPSIIDDDDLTFSASSLKIRKGTSSLEIRADGIYRDGVKIL